MKCAIIGGGAAGFFTALSFGFPNFLSAILKYLFYLFLNKRKKKEIYQKRVLGFINALFGKSSSFSTANF